MLKIFRIIQNKLDQIFFVGRIKPRVFLEVTLQARLASLKMVKSKFLQIILLAKSIWKLFGILSIIQHWIVNYSSNWVPWLNLASNLSLKLSLHKKPQPWLRLMVKRKWKWKPKKARAHWLMLHQNRKQLLKKLPYEILNCPVRSFSSWAWVESLTTIRPSIWPRIKADYQVFSNNNTQLSYLPKIAEYQTCKYPVFG